MATLREAAEELAAEIRHVAVTDGPELTGIVSIRDVVNVILEEASRDAVAG